MSFVRVEPAVSFSLASSVGWIDLDLSSSVSVDATGVILKVINLTAAKTAVVGSRMNGSSDTRAGALYALRSTYTNIGLDDNKIIETLSSGASSSWKLLGYTEGEDVYFTNGIDVSLSTTATWLDIDISTSLSGSDTSIGAIVEVVNGGYAYGMRKDASTDARTQIFDGNNGQNVWTIGTTNNIFEGYINNSNVDFYLLGYIKSGSNFYVNAPDVSISVSGAYEDVIITGLALGAYIEVNVAANSYSMSLRPNDSSDDFYYIYRSYHSVIYTGADASGVIEGEISNVLMDFFLLGYPISSDVVSATSAILNLSNTIQIMTNNYSETTGQKQGIVVLPIGTECLLSNNSNTTSQRQSNITVVNTLESFLSNNSTTVGQKQSNVTIPNTLEVLVISNSDTISKRQGVVTPNAGTLLIRSIDTSTVSQRVGVVSASVNVTDIVVTPNYTLTIGQKQGVVDIPVATLTIIGDITSSVGTLVSAVAAAVDEILNRIPYRTPDNPTRAARLTITRSPSAATRVRRSYYDDLT